MCLVRQAGDDAESATGRGFKLEMAAQSGNALAHAGQAQAATGLR